MGWEWEKPGRFLRPQCRPDFCEGERGSLGVVLREYPQGWWGAGSPWGNFTHQRNPISHRIGLISYPCWEPWETWSLCKGGGEFRMHHLPSIKLPPQETWEAHIHGCHTSYTKRCNQKMVGSNTKVAISLFHISKASKISECRKARMELRQVWPST